MSKGLIAAMIAGAVLYGSYRVYQNQNPADSSGALFIDAGAALKNITGKNMQTSQAGKDAIAAREGRRNAVYDDGAGFLTVGVGHKLRPSDGRFSIGDIVADDRIDAWFFVDISHAENTVNFYVTVPMTQGMFDALVSAVFNLGSGFFKNSDGTATRVLTYLNTGRPDLAAAEFPKWNHAGGRILAGLTARRLSEQQQFLA